MRVWPMLVVSALLGAGCASQAGSNNSSPSAGGAGAATSGSGGARSDGSGGASNGGGNGGSSTGSGGSNSSGSGGTPGMGGATASGGSSGAGGAQSGGSGGQAGENGSNKPDATGAEAGGPPAMGGKALLITGTLPLVGTDVQIETALKARGMEVEAILEKNATPAQATDKRIILLSYGMLSTAFKAEAFTDVPVPIVVMEHHLLPRLKMSNPHGFTGRMTKITMVSDHELAGGFPKGDLEVYSPSQEFFWGTPSANGIRIAHLVGQPDKVTYFAYEKGAMMDGAMAPAKRVQFFHASHSPDPVDKNLYLNANGLKLLGVTIDWCLK